MSLLVAIAAGLVVWACWAAGLLQSMEQPAQRLAQVDQNDILRPESWMVLMFVATASVTVGYCWQRAGAWRTVLLVFPGLILYLVVNSIALRVLAIDLAVAPVSLSAICAIAAVQFRKVSEIDSELARTLNRTASEISALEGQGAADRLAGGLKLLDTVLPLEEAIVFIFDDEEILCPGARIRNERARVDSARHAEWREGVKLCEKAIRARQTEVSEKVDGLTVAVPLRHENHDVGAILIRLREKFDDNDRPLLAAVSAQLARDIQRDEARKGVSAGRGFKLFSTQAAAQKLAAYSAVSGLLTEQRFGAEVLSHASDAHAVAYLDGTIAYLNGAMLDAAELDHDESRSLDLFGLLDRFRGGVFDEPSIAVRRVLQTGAPYEREIEYPDRAKTYSLRIALARETAGKDEAEADPLCLAITVKDVTRMKEYDKMRSDMASLMSHELRTPITSINGFAELLALDEAIPAESREFLNIIVNESQRLVRMINTFLAVSQLQQGDKQEVLKIPLKLDEVVQETVSTMHQAARKKRIRLVAAESQRMPPVAADKGLITQAVVNLVDNAIRYSPEKSTVTISTELEADSVRLKVEDRGYGIPPEAADKVWEKFYRVARDGHEKDEGSTGLGLSFVREIIEQHGGDVCLQSEVGRGSTFSFTLPRL